MVHSLVGINGDAAFLVALVAAAQDNDKNAEMTIVPVIFMGLIIPQPRPIVI